MKPSSLIALLALGLLVTHLLVIVEDVQVLLQDPHQANKPRELLKLAVDLNRYFG